MASDPRFEVAIGAARFDPRESQQNAVPNNEPRAGVFGWVVQFEQPLTADERERLQQRFGLRLTAFVPKLSYVERLSEGAAAELRSDPAVRAVTPYLPSFKVAPTVGNSVGRDDEPATVFLVAIPFADADPAAVATQLSELGAHDLTVTDRRGLGVAAAIRFRIADNLVAAVTQLADVRWIEPVAEIVDDEPSRQGAALWGDSPSTVDGQPAVADQVDAQLDGSGEIIGLIDNGPPDLDHCFFADPHHEPGPDHRKIVQLRNASATAAGVHPTFVAGCAVGDDVAAPGQAAWRGGAWAARLACGNRNDLAAFDAAPGAPTRGMFEELSAAAAAGATVHSNSFHVRPQGPRAPATYDTTAADVDTFLWLNEDHLVLGSSGNTGEEQGPPGTAKNAVCVAAAVDAQPRLGDGAPGPTADGRRKPDLMVVGCGRQSALLGTTTGIGPRASCASSYATPLAAAAAALVRQYFRAGFHPSGRPSPGAGLVPSGALLKAVLLNSTISPPAPDHATGWGLLALRRGLFFGGSSRRLAVWDVRNADGLQTDQSAKHVLTVIGSAGPLELTLAWTEPAGTVGAADPMINELAFDVIAPDGTPVDVDAETEAGNVRRLRIEQPTVGDWTLVVRAVAVNVGNPGQGYAIAAGGELTPPAT